MQLEPDLATIATLIGEPTRALILGALMSGEALPASELAYQAGITPQTASSHLSKLLDGRLIKVTPSGRHRYYSLQSHEVATLLETLQLIAPIKQSPLQRSPKIDPELCHARTCYDHLAGKLGVAVTQSMMRHNYLVDGDEHYALTSSGIDWLATHNINSDALQKKRRKFAYPCLDWSERQFHIGGSLGAAIADLFLEQGWIKRLPHTRAVQVTKLGKKVLRDDFVVELDVERTN